MIKKKRFQVLSCSSVGLIVMKGLEAEKHSWINNFPPDTRENAMEEFSLYGRLQ